MTQNQSFTHITLDTGDTRDSRRSEVADEVVQLLQPLVLSALRGERVPLPASVQPPSYLSGGTDDGCAIVLTVSVEQDRSPLATLAVAPAEASEESARSLWRHLHALPILPRAARLDRGSITGRPAAPWCGVRLGVGILRHPQATEWLGDLERCLAWAWIEADRRPPPG
jgi:hypothetical protein